MAECRALIPQDDIPGLLGDCPAVANDDPALPRCGAISHLTLPDAPRLASCPANDDWIEADLPISINVLAEEIAILDQFLRAHILALFD